MQHTRQQIVDYLQINRAASSNELSRVLLVTPANIRHHLRWLNSSEIVEVVGQEPIRGRGRPTKLFGLTETARKNNLGGLVRALLHVLKSDNGDLEILFAHTADHLMGDFQTDQIGHAQLSQIVDKLNQLKYQTTWEASPDGPRIIMRNCPYALILPEHPELCLLDKKLLSSMLNHDVEQTGKMMSGPGGSPHCVFIFRNDEQA